MSDDVRDRSGRFKPGKSGNPSGVSKRSDRDRDPEAYYARRDGWASALTGIGDVNRDKRMSHGFVAPIMTYQDAMELWRGDDIARRAIESVPRECLREGYELTISDEGKFDDLKDEVEQKLLDLHANEAIFRAFCFERAYGGAAILIGANDGRALDKSMEIENVRSVDWLKVIEPIELQPYKHYDDPSKAKYGEISHYQLTQNPTSTASGDSMRSLVPRVIHESRLIVFPGLKVSAYQSSSNMTNAAWGDPILLALVEVLRDFNVAWHGAGIIATDFAQPVLSMENLMQLVSKQPQQVAARALALEMQRSNARAVLIDTKEKYERQSTTIAGLPDLLNQLSMRLAAAVDMPLTLLMGQSPKGLGNEGDSDVRFYYDRIRGVQKEKVAPILRLLIHMIMRTIRQRKLPKRWSVRFNPLWQLTDQEKAEARLAQARVDSMYIKMGATTCDEIRFSRFGGEYSWDTQIEENKPAPGIPEIELALKQAEMQAAAMSAAPAPDGGTKGVAGRSRVQGYARRNPTGAKKVVAAAKEGGDVSPVTRDHADTSEPYMTLADYQAARERLIADGKMTPALEVLISELEEMWHEDERVEHELRGGNCDASRNCSVCAKAKTPVAKTSLDDNMPVDPTDVTVCPECGDMMVGEHECGAPDPKENA